MKVVNSCFITTFAPYDALIFYSFGFTPTISSTKLVKKVSEL